MKKRVEESAIKTIVPEKDEAALRMEASVAVATKQNNNGVIVCDRCEEAPACFMCAECGNLPFCEPCCEDVHMKGRWKSHRVQPFNQAGDSSSGE